MKKKHKVLKTRHDIESEGLPSGSGFDADFRCLGKRALEAQVRLPEKERVDAARGDRIHLALKESDLSGLSKSDEITASRCMYAESELVHEFDFEHAEAEWEVRLWDIDDDLNHLWSVKPDTVLYTRDTKRVMVVNYKTGFGSQVPIKDNWQAKAEGVAVHFTYQPREVIHTMVHPHHPDSLYEVIRFTPDMLDVHLETIRGNVALISNPEYGDVIGYFSERADARSKVAIYDTPDLPRSPNGISCQWCRAKGVCPEYKEWAQSTAKAVEEENETLGFAGILDRSPEERGDHVTLLMRLRGHIEAQLEQYVKLEDRTANSVKGYKIQNRWLRKIKSETKALRIVREQFGENAADHALVFSLTDLENYLKKKVGAKAAEERVRSALKPVIKYEKSKSWLVKRIT